MTAIEKVKVIVFGDVNDTTYTDAEIQVFLDLTGDDQSELMASAMILDARALSSATSSSSGSGASLAIGDYSQSDSQSVSATSSAYKQQAEILRELYYNTPAFAIVEDNLSWFGEAQLVRNYISRHEGV